MEVYLYNDINICTHKMKKLTPARVLVGVQENSKLCVLLIPIGFLQNVNIFLMTD